MKKKKAVNFGPKCMVTGSSGFLGRALTESLVEHGYTVHALDVRPFPDKNRHVKSFTGDIRDYDTVLSAAEGCSTVFHCAAVMNFLGLSRQSIRDEVFGINVGGTENVVKACVEAGVSRLVYTSSHNVCFDPGTVINGDESKPYAASYLDLYSETKTEAEKIVLSENGKHGLNTVALRPGGIWGPDKSCYMFSKFIDQLEKGKLVATIGDSGAIIDNTHVDNLVQAEIQAASKLIESPEIVGGQAYFIMDEEPMNLMEWFRPLIEGLGYKMPDKSIPRFPMYWLAFLAECLYFAGGPRPFMTRLEVHNLTTKFTFRTDKARRDLGYRPTIGNAKGMKECINFYKKIINNNGAGSREK